MLKISSIAKINKIRDKLFKKKEKRETITVVDAVECAKKEIMKYVDAHIQITEVKAIEVVNRHCFKIRTDQDIDIVKTALKQLEDELKIKYWDCCKKYFIVFA